MLHENLKSIKKIISLLLIFFFFILILIPNVGIDYHETKSDRENRTLASFPGKFSRTFGMEFEQWYNDRFFGRNFYISIMEFFNLNLKSSVGNDQVILGKDGWIFLNAGGMCVRDYMNIERFTDAELKGIAEYISGFSDWCRENGKEFLFVVAPDKMRVYGEFYPDCIKKMNPDSASRVCQLIDYFEKNSSVRPLYLIDDLLEEKNKSRELLYYKNDTHWNDLGGYIGYSRINEVFGQIGAERIFIDEWSKVKNERGDLNNLYPEGTRNDGVTEYPLAKYDFTYSSNCVDSRHPYDSECKDGKKSLVVFRDSFFNAMHPYFSQQFKSVKDYWKREVAAEDLEYLKENGDVVIYEVVERLLFQLSDLKFPVNLEKDGE